MAFDVPKAIEKLAEAVKNGFRYAEEAKEHQSETEVLKELKRKCKGIDAAENLIIMMYPCFTPANDEEERKFAKLLKIFLENN